MSAVSVEDRFLFDLQGFLVLREVLSAEECAAYRETLSRLESRSYDDPWQATLSPGPPGRPTRETQVPSQLRLNGLPRLDPLFDELIDHPRVLPLLQEFVGLPQLINTWSISKTKGAPSGGWHRGVPPTDYSCRNGEIRSRMLNVVYFLTDNGPDDGCMVAIPASHKNNIDLPWREYPGLTMPGAVAITGRAGDVLLFSEAVLHDGLPKTSEGVRTNLYFNYVHAHYNVMTREPRNCHHFYFPPAIRERFTPARRELTAWMELARWDF
jgi:hypothetical protein